MFIDFLDYDGKPVRIQSRHIMAYWASVEQQAMKPPQVSFMMQCGTGSEEWYIRDTLDGVKEKLRHHWGIEPDDYNGSGNCNLRGTVSTYKRP